MTQQAPILATVLSGLLRQRGRSLLGDRRRILGLLRDKVPNEGRAIRILMTAFDQGVPARLGQGAVSDLDIGREVSLLLAETGIGPDYAREAVETWAAALANVAPPGLRPTGEARIAPAAAMPPSPATEPLPAVEPLAAPKASVMPLPAVEALPAPKASVMPLPAVEPLPAPKASVMPLPIEPLAPDPSAEPATAPRAPRAQPVSKRPVQVWQTPPQAAPPREAAPLAGETPGVQPLPVQPLPSPAAVRPLPAQGQRVQPLPVQPLPVQPLPRQAADDGAARRGSVHPPAAPAAKGAGLGKWSGIVIGVIVLLSSLARLAGLGGSHGTASPQSDPPPAATPAPTQQPAKMATTPEGVAIATLAPPFAVYHAERIKDDPETLAFNLGIAVNNKPFTYYLAYAFDKGKPAGSAILNLVKDNKVAKSSGVVTANRTIMGDKAYTFLSAAIPLPNGWGAPGLCVYTAVAPNFDRLDIYSGSSVQIYALNAAGACDTGTRLGAADLQ